MKKLKVEHACALCVTKDGRIVHGVRTKGNDHKVHVKVKCPRGSIPIALWHNHPGGIAKLSAQDVKTTRKLGLDICCVTDDSARTKCYNVRKKK